MDAGWHTLPDGTRLELLHAPPAAAAAAAAAAAPTPRPPLLFVHGSYHGAWCWRERFLPYFAAAGWDCYAVSLRGQGGSDREGLKVSGSLQVGGGREGRKKERKKERERKGEAREQRLCC